MAIVNQSELQIGKLDWPVGPVPFGVNLAPIVTNAGQPMVAYEILQQTGVFAFFLTPEDCAHHVNEQTDVLAQIVGSGLWTPEQNGHKGIIIPGQE